MRSSGELRIAYQFYYFFDVPQYFIVAAAYVCRSPAPSLDVFFFSFIDMESRSPEKD